MLSVSPHPSAKAPNVALNEQILYNNISTQNKLFS